MPTGATRFGPQNGPQNGPESDPKTDPFLDPFLGPFWAPFWAPFGSHLGPKTGLGEAKRSPREPKGAPRDQKEDFRKSGFRMRLSAFFRSWDPRRRPQEAKKTAKKRPEGAKKPQKRDPKTNLKKERIRIHFWANFGTHFGLQNSRKSAPKMGPENDAKKSKKRE